MNRRRMLVTRMLGGGGGAAVAPMDFLFRDDFVTDDPNPLAIPRTAEPGPGTWDAMTDTAAKLSISSGNLASLSNTAANDPLLSGALPGLAGVAAGVHHIGACGVGWRENHSEPKNAGIFVVPGNVDWGLQLWNTTSVTYFPNPVQIGETIQSLVILRPTGLFYLIKSTITYTTWTLIMADSTPITGGFTGLTKIALKTEAATVGSVRATQLHAPWTENYAIAKSYTAGATGEGATFVHGDNYQFTFEATKPTAGTVEMRFRIQDANNYWSYAINTAGDQTLAEVVAGASTTRGTKAAAVATKTKIVLTVDGNRITVIRARAKDISYASATTFHSATGGEVESLGTGGAVEELAIFDRELGGIDTAELESFFT